VTGLTKKNKNSLKPWWVFAGTCTHHSDVRNQTFCMFAGDAVLTRDDHGSGLKAILAGSDSNFFEDWRIRTGSHWGKFCCI